MRQLGLVRFAKCPKADRLITDGPFKLFEAIRQAPLQTPLRTNNSSVSGDGSKLESLKLTKTRKRVSLGQATTRQTFNKR
jgi:hypothetical protein